jgi:hypothetical protein
MGYLPQEELQQNQSPNPSSKAYTINGAGMAQEQVSFGFQPEHFKDQPTASDRPLSTEQLEAQADQYQYLPEDRGFRQSTGAAEHVDRSTYMPRFGTEGSQPWEHTSDTFSPRSNAFEFSAQMLWQQPLPSSWEVWPRHSCCLVHKAHLL